MFQRHAERLVQHGGNVLDGFSGEARRRHGIVNALDMGPLDRLEFHSPDSGGYMVLDYCLIALERQRLDLVCTKGIQPFPEPGGDSNPVWGLVGAIVKFSKDGGHLLSDGGL